jgi:hypothetical protein
VILRGAPEAGVGCCPGHPRPKSASRPSHYRSFLLFFALYRQGFDGLLPFTERGTARLNSAKPFTIMFPEDL